MSAYRYYEITFGHANKTDNFLATYPIFGSFSLQEIAVIYTKVKEAIEGLLEWDGCDLSEFHVCLIDIPPDQKTEKYIKCINMDRIPIKSHIKLALDGKIAEITSSTKSSINAFKDIDDWKSKIDKIKVSEIQSISLALHESGVPYREIGITTDGLASSSNPNSNQLCYSFRWNSIHFAEIFLDSDNYQIFKGDKLEIMNFHKFNDFKIAFLELLDGDKHEEVPDSI